MLAELKTRVKLKKSKTEVKWKNQSVHLTEAIASKDNNNLYITSSFFRDQVKYKAFCAYYAVMRLVDDRVDNLSSSVHSNKESCNRELAVVNAWEQVISSCGRGIYPNTFQLEACDFAEAGAVCASLIEAFRALPVPIKLWTNFFDAMRSDICADEFDSWSDFLAYAEGATVAPTTIYLMLIAAHRNEANYSYELPAGFDLPGCGRNLGIFAYLGHIIRDLAEDIKDGTTRLCITRKDMNKYGVTPGRLTNEAWKHQASSSTCNMVADILQRARYYLLKGRTLTTQIQELLDADCRFILELIIRMYEHIVAKIESAGFDPMTNQHHLTKKEKIDIVQSVAAATGYSLPDWVNI